MMYPQGGKSETSGMGSSVVLHHTSLVVQIFFEVDEVSLFLPLGIHNLHCREVFFFKSKIQKNSNHLYENIERRNVRMNTSKSRYIVKIMFL